MSKQSQPEKKSEKVYEVTSICFVKMEPIWDYGPLGKVSKQQVIIEKVTSGVMLYKKDRSGRRFYPTSSIFYIEEKEVAQDSPAVTVPEGTVV